MQEQFKTDPIVRGEGHAMFRLFLSLIIGCVMMITILTMDSEKATQVSTEWERLKLVKWQLLTTVLCLIAAMIIWMPFIIAHIRAVFRTDGRGYF